MCCELESKPCVRARGWLLLLALVLALIGGIADARAQIDPGINPTVWKMLYGVTDAQINDPTWLAADDDGDGITNGAELAAGTNPFDATSAFRTTTAPTGNGSMTLTFPTAAGKQYLLQSTTDLTNPAGWTQVASVLAVTGTGLPLTLVTPVSDAAANVTMYYRVAVQDVDSDGDGLSDWAEKITGFDPTTTHTHGATQDDHTALLADFAQENVITVSAPNSTATQPPDALTAATDTATITITRGGTLHFSRITVPLNWTGTAITGVDYASLPASVTFPPKVGTITLTVIPLANPARQTPATVTLAARPGGGYALGAASSASAVISPAALTSGTGLTGTYFNYNYTALKVAASTITTYNPTVLFAGTPILTRIEGPVDFYWSSVAPATGSPGTNTTTNVTVGPTYFGARWQGQIQPQYSETYVFDVYADDGVKLYINGQLVVDGWANGSSDRLGSIALQAGVLYDIKLEYYQYTGSDQVHLYWYSNSQVKQLVPAARLYPLAATPAPPAITSAPTAFGFVGQPFAFNVTASLSGGTAATFALGNGSGPLPPGLTLNTVTGVISGTPTTAGDWQVALTASNASGVGGSVLDIQILNPGSGVTRELWQNLPTGNISDLPLTTTPATTDTTLLTLEDNATYGSNTGERLRGYFTAPTTGNYYFWLAASNNAELWISDNAQPASLVRRAWVTAPGTAAEIWNDAGQTRQRSPWLALVGGQRYYYEVLHNTGTATVSGSSLLAASTTTTGKRAAAGGGRKKKTAVSAATLLGSNATGSVSNNLSVGFLLDSTGAALIPSAGTGGGVVPGYVLYPYDYPTTTAANGTLFGTNLSPQGTAVSAATGAANLRLLPGNAQAILHFSYGGLSSPRTAYHIHIAPDSTGSGPIVFDLDDVDKFHPELKTADGGYIWNITDSGAYTAAQIVTAIQGGTTYFNVHTVNYPNGEIRGFLTLVNGSQNPPTLVADPGFTDDSGTDAGAARFLNQAAYGAAPADMTAVKNGGYAAWIAAQMGLPPNNPLPATHLLPDVLNQAIYLPSATLASTSFDNAWWRASVTAPDQLRQRTAFALSEILVVSDTVSTLGSHADGLASFYDTLADNAFGNFRDLLKAVTLHPTMGFWLNMVGNFKGNLATGQHPNENYAREVLQLFSIGLNRRWPDGSLVLDSQGNLVPTYTQDAITNGFARVFTGWTWNQPLQANGQLPTNFYPSTADYLNPMVMVKNYHELGTKTLLDNVVLPAANGYSLTAAIMAGTQADKSTAAYDSYCLQDLELAIDNIFYHPNVGPYVCRQLIQRLVESNPSPAYVYRVVQKFNDDGTSAHVRGNMAAVVQAILLDGEARNAAAALASMSAGKQREPLLRIAAPARTFLAAANSGTYSQTGTTTMTVTTANPHAFSAGDAVPLDFTVNNTGTPAVPPPDNPSSGGYTVLSSPAPTANTFAVTAAGFYTATYTQAANSTTLIVNTTAVPVGEKLYLKPTTGSASEGVYTVASVSTSPVNFTVTTATAPTTALSGTVMIPRVSGYYVVTNPTGATATTPSTITVSTYTTSNVKPGNHIWLNSGQADQLKDGEFVVDTVVSERYFTLVNSTHYVVETSPFSYVYPLVPQQMTRSGNVGLPSSKFDMGNTNGQVVQTPLDAPTVFNFYYPDYEYPGTLSSNGVTTPEFELTTDSNIVTLTNNVASTILSSSNTNGLCNFKSGAINLDLSPYINAYSSVATTSATTSGTGTGTSMKLTATTTVTTTVDANGLVNKLGDVLTGGTLSTAAKTAIVNFVNDPVSFPVSVSASLSGTVGSPPATPAAPATTSARDKVRAVVHAILVSPEYAIQR